MTLRMPAASLAFLLLAGCATVQHPASPGVQYGSMDSCYSQHLNDSPLDCTKTIHKEATTQAIGVGATILLILSYLGIIALALAGGR